MKEAIPSFFANLPKQWEAELPYLKLKYGLGDLEDNQSMLRERSYFLSDAAFAPSLPRLVKLFLRAKKEKQLKSRFLIVAKESDVLALSPEDSRDIRFLSSLTEAERAVFTQGALAGIVLQQSAVVDGWLREVVAFQLPLILAKTPELMDRAGHAPLYVDPEDDTEIINALIKIEGSRTLRTHIETLQRDEIRA